MTREQMEQLDEMEAWSPFVTRAQEEARYWNAELTWQEVVSAMAVRITRLECEVSWLRHELEQKGEAK
jgi:hypothetical protein